MSLMSGRLRRGWEILPHRAPGGWDFAESEQQVDYDPYWRRLPSVPFRNVPRRSHRPRSGRRLPANDREAGVRKAILAVTSESPPKSLPGNRRTRSTLPPAIRR